MKPGVTPEMEANLRAHRERSRALALIVGIPAGVIGAALLILGYLIVHGPFR